MNDSPSSSTQPASAIPADDPQRTLTLARPNEDHTLPHIGLVGDTYTILVTGKDTAGRYCLIDTHVPPGGGPPPHRHDFEENFAVLDGEIAVTFRGENSVVRAGESVNVPANAPHSFTNASDKPARLLCLCSPPGVEEFFISLGVPVATRTTLPPKARRGRPGGVQGEGRSARSEISDGASKALTCFRASRRPCHGAALLTVRTLASETFFMVMAMSSSPARPQNFSPSGKIPTPARFLPPPSTSRPRTARAWGNDIVYCLASFILGPGLSHTSPGSQPNKKRDSL